MVFERDLGLLAAEISRLDLSEEFQNQRLILWADFENFSPLFALEFVQNSALIYTLLGLRESEEKAALDARLRQEFSFLALQKGNDAEDNLIAIRHNLTNLPALLSRIAFKDFLSAYRFAGKNALIVSTGPSLTKQLPLLKEVQENALIFAADSAYKILREAGINPDFVLSMERVHWTSEFFREDWGGESLFILSSLTHPKSVEFLEKNGKNFMLVLRPFYFEKALNLDDYGYLGEGASVANMAYELAAALRFERIFFIGQDLAYDKTGLSHAREYFYLKDHEGDFKQDAGKFLSPAYGGAGVVESSLVWTLFRWGLERDIERAKILGVQTFNATEGGARIKGTVEKPFSECCAEFLQKREEKKRLNLEARRVDLKGVLRCLRGLFEEGEKWRRNFEEILKNESTETQYLALFNKIYFEFKASPCHAELFVALSFHYAQEQVKLEALNADLKDKINHQKQYAAAVLELLQKQNALLEGFLKENDAL